jgi:peptidylprolyl isomerase
VPQSRHRKVGKAKKRPRGSYPVSNSAPSKKNNQQIRLIAIGAVAILAIATVTYVIANRVRGGTEITTPSGLKYTDLRVGSGDSPRKGQTVVVNYLGTLENGKKFESSYDNNQPAEFQIGVGRVIKGWDEGLMTMKVGGKRKLVIPSALGYGPMGRAPNIPGNSTLVFEVELVGLKESPTR